MKDNLTKTYLFDARHATPDYPEANRYCCSLLPVLTKLLHKEERLHIITSAETLLPEITPLQKVTIHRSHASPGSIRCASFARKLIKTISPDLYHSATLYDPCPKNIRSIATIHRICPLNKAASQSTLQKRLVFRLRIKPRLQHCDTFISISSTLLKSYTGTGIENRCEIIPYGVAPQFKAVSAEEVESVKEKYFLPKRFLLMIAAGENTRNLTTVLDALQSTDFTETAPLVIAGYSSQCDGITKLIEQRSLTTRVHQTGPIDGIDMPALYSAAFALLFPNIIKGTGLPVIEAMACGTPVICSSLPVLIELTAGAATMVHPTDKLEWRRAISSALLSIKWHEESSAAALERAKLYSWEIAATDTLKIYRDRVGSTSLREL